MSPGTIRFGKKSEPRQPRFAEAMALLVGALATAGRWAGIKTVNAIGPDGQPLALAVIEGARFGTQNGKTTLNAVLDYEENHV